MSSLTARAMDSAFGHPRGLLGRMGGALMARGNAATELQIVKLAHLSRSDDVVVVGPGPGVGLRAAGELAGRVVGVEPSDRMRRDAERRCKELVDSGRVEIVDGSAERTGLPDRTFDVALSVNNMQLWTDRRAAWTELRRVLRPEGLLLVSSHERWLPGGRMDLQREADAAGFGEVQTWAWEPPGRMASTAVQLRAVRPSAD